MWLGKGGWFACGNAIARSKPRQNLKPKPGARNSALDAEVRDFKTGFEAIEERARSEFGMIRAGEVFVQVQQRPERGGEEPSAAVARPPDGSASLPIRPAARTGERR